jgi:signal transduction histidine kinase
MERRWLRGIPIQLLLWSTVPAMLVLIVLAFAGVIGHQRAMRELVLARDARVAQMAARRLSDRLQMQLARLQALAAELDENNASAADETSAPLLTQHSTLIASFDQGVALISSAGQPLETLPPNLDTAALAAAIEPLRTPSNLTQPEVLPLTQEPNANRSTLWMAAPVPARQSWVIGGISFTQLDLSSLLGEAAPGNGGASYIVNDTGRVIAASKPTELLSLIDRSGVAAALNGEADAIIDSIDSTTMVVGYAPIEPVGWALVVQEPWSAVIGPMMRFSLVAPLILVVAAVAALISIVFGLRSIVRPLQQLDAQAAQLAWGDFNAVKTPVGGTQEIEDLRHTLNYLSQQIRAYQQGMRGYIDAITRGQEEERKRLARELHDDTVQDLIALSHRIEMARRTLQHDPAAASQRLDELKALVDESLAELRRFTRALRPIYLEDLGLLPAIEMLVRDVEATGGLSASFRATGQPRRLTEEIELTLFRIAQEALTNVVQHAQASTVDLVLDFTPDEVLLTVEDNGVGFSVPDRPEGLARAGHFGLVGMRERAALVGARLTLASQPGAGTRVAVHVPSPASA